MNVPQVYLVSVRKQFQIFKNEIRFSLTYSTISVYFQLLNIDMVVLKVLREFARGTKIHGFNFLVSPKSSPRIKIIWAISIVVALSYASWEMRNSAISKYHYTLPTPWLMQVWSMQNSPTWLFKRFPFLTQHALINSIKWKYEIKLVLTWLTWFFQSTERSV